MSRRLFVAVDPPEEARADLERALAPLREAPGAPRWTATDRWHLTLLFLGAVPDDVVPGLTDALGQAVGSAPAMTLRLTGAGRFGSLRRPQVFWAGLDGDVVPLVAVAERLARAARERDLQVFWAGLDGDVVPLVAVAERLARAARELDLPVEERPFRPHLTLGRWPPRRPADGTLPERLAGYRGPAWPVADVRLVESHLGRRSPYETVAAWPIERPP